MELHYCRRCGEPLNQNDHGGYTCANGHAIYSNPAPTVGVFLFDSDGSVVMSIRGIEPDKGMIDSFGGFVDDDETFEQAAIRELEEETGLTAKDYSPLVYLTSAPSNYLFGGESRAVLSCFYFATLTPGAVPTAQDDVASVVVIKPQDVSPSDIGGDDVRAGFAALLQMVS
jgi:NAD+ diphosphatase